MTADGWVLRSYVTLAATASAPFWARRHTADVLSGWSLGGLHDTAELVVTELVTNAVKASGVELDERSHEGTEVPFLAAPVPRAPDGRLQSGPGHGATGGLEQFEPRRRSYAELRETPMVRLRLSADRARRGLLIEVWDRNPEPPVMQEPNSVSEGGRGLLLVGALCERWGWWWPEVAMKGGKAWPRASFGGPAQATGLGRYGKVVWGVTLE